MAPPTQMQRGWSRRWLALRDAPALGQPASTLSAASPKSRVKRLEIQPTLVRARVADPETVDCDVEIRAPRLSDAEWSEVLDLMANQALISAQLLAGQVPVEVESLFAAANLSVLPRAEEMIHHCSCCHTTKCRHVLEVYRAVGDLVDEDPWLLLQLRGKSRQEIADALREQRHNGKNGPSVVQEHPDSGSGLSTTQIAVADENRAPSLASELDTYWGSVKALESFHHRFTPPRLEFALLRRLGPVLFDQDGPVVHETVAAAHRLVSKEALALAYAAEPVEREASV